MCPSRAWGDFNILFFPLSLDGVRQEPLAARASLRTTTQHYYGRNWRLQNGVEMKKKIIEISNSTANKPTLPTTSSA